MAAPSSESSEIDVWCQDAENALKVVKERRAAIQQRSPLITTELRKLANDVREWHSSMIALYDEHGIKANEICIAKDGTSPILSHMIWTNANRSQVRTEILKHSCVVTSRFIRAMIWKCASMPLNCSIRQKVLPT